MVGFFLAWTTHSGAVAQYRAARYMGDAGASGESEDVAGTGEEEFEVGMRQNAMEYDANDDDGDNMLDMSEFSQMVRDREGTDVTDEHIAARFKQLDVDGSGKVDPSEYLQFSLRDALARSSERVCDLFRKWDEDKNGKVDKHEFTRAMKALGFHLPDDEIGKVFDSLDDDHSGMIEYKELNAMLRKGTGSDLAKRNLQRGGAASNRSRGAKLTARNLNANFGISRVAALPPMVKLDPTNGKSVVEQLKNILDENSVKLVDVFREWDADGNGAIDKKEFRAAVAALGYDVPKKDLNILFDELDDSGDGFIEYEELKKALRNYKQYTALVYKPVDPAPASAPVAEPSSPPRPPEVIVEDVKPHKRNPPRKMPDTLLGRRIKVYWPLEDAWYSGVVNFHLKTAGWRVAYDKGGAKEGIERWHDLEGFQGEKWEQYGEDAPPLGEPMARPPKLRPNMPTASSARKEMALQSQVGEPISEARPAVAPTGERKTLTKSLVGERVRIFSIMENDWLEGVITQYHWSCGWRVAYDEVPSKVHQGHELWHDLDMERWEHLSTNMNAYPCAARESS